ncbi:hypothetical protein ACWC9T_18750 [Kitasatospora sp. NPDC001159]
MAGYREEDFRRITAEPGCCHDLTDRIELSALEPLVARPSSPGNVVPVHEVAGTQTGQAVLGSSANPGLRDYAVAAAVVHGRQASAELSFDVNPSSREVLQDLLRTGAAFDPRRRRPDPPGRSPGLHRQWAGPRLRPPLAAHLPAQLPRPLRRRWPRYMRRHAGRR